MNDMERAMVREKTRCRVWMAAEAAMSATLNLGARSYQRERDLPALVGVDWTEAGSASTVVAARILRRLGRALRRERWRGRAGHPDYDLARHCALIQAWRAEAHNFGRHNPLRPAACRQNELHAQSGRPAAAAL